MGITVFANSLTLTHLCFSKAFCKSSLVQFSSVDSLDFNVSGVAE